ncbi:MAG: hypothetical protein Q9168_004470 [Polycauliona sp. 1 TL-2023]
MSDKTCNELIDQLASGFGALLEQVQELDTKNANLEHLLDRMQKQIQDNNLASSFDHSSNTLPAGEDSGLHIECEDTQLHLNRVPRETKWLITDGFKAWNKVRSGGIAQHLGSNHIMAKHPNESNDPKPANTSMAKDDAQRCPFAALQSAAPNPHTASSSRDGTMSPEPTHDHALTNGTAKDPIAAEHHPASTSSLVASQPGSASKCPIRFLDQHSPEEVAEYFRNHRHEIPRSHEICVKRYQKNEDQIRQLDHKYGSLVNMIQGLGQKHQPMLPMTNGDVENISQPRTARDSKVEEWAQHLNGNGDDPKFPAEIKSNDIIIKPEPEPKTQDEEEEEHERSNHFTRPLKEIRVGESPSRPWGISIPHGAHIPASATSPSSKHHPPNSNSNHQESVVEKQIKENYRTMEAGEKAVEEGGSGGRAGMVFTGPVFIGYAPDQIADILRRTGLDGRS